TTATTPASSSTPSTSTSSSASSSTTTSTSTSSSSSTTTTSTTTSTASTSTTTTAPPPASRISVSNGAGGPGDRVQLPVRLDLLPGVSVVTLQFNLTVVPEDSAPHLDDAVVFTGALSAAPNFNLAEGKETVLVGWLSPPLSPPLAGGVQVGNLEVAIPASASPGARYRIDVVNPSATSDGQTDVPLEAASGFLTVSGPTTTTSSTSPTTSSTTTSSTSTSSTTISTTSTSSSSSSTTTTTSTTSSTSTTAT